MTWRHYDLVYFPVTNNEFHKEIKSMMLHFPQRNLTHFIYVYRINWCDKLSFHVINCLYEVSVLTMNITEQVNWALLKRKHETEIYFQKNMENEILLRDFLICLRVFFCSNTKKINQTELYSSDNFFQSKAQNLNNISIHLF